MARKKQAKKPAKKVPQKKESPVKKTAPSKKDEQTRSISFRIEWIVIALLLIVFVGSVATKGFSQMPFGINIPFLGGEEVKSEDEIKDLVTKYINDVVLQGQSTAEIVEIVEDEDSHLYKIKLIVAEQEYTSFVSKDGKHLYIDRMEIDLPEETDDSDSTEASTASYPKSDKPEVLMFTMSYCPYGNQAEDMIEPVQALLGSNATIEPHYVIYNKDQGYSGKDYCLDDNDQYCSMHGIQELNQDIRELCTYKHQPDKFWDFVMAANADCDYKNVDKCWEDVAKSVGVNVDKIKSCEANEAIDLLKKEVELNQKYSVTGSPTVVINGIRYEGSRTPEAFKTALCSSYNTEPEACGKTLDDSAAATDGSCN